MGVLANVMEAEGLATVALMSVRGQAERVRAPRALFCEFPLGRPLGRPGDAALQRRVLEAAFALLAVGEPDVPILAEFPETIVDDTSPLACPLPPRFDPSLHPAVDEARALRAAYERAVAQHGGRTAVGKACGPDGVPDALAAFVRVAAGEPSSDVGLPGYPPLVASDVRAYYEEAAAALASHVPAARQAEEWFFEQTEAGKVMRDAASAMRAGGVSRIVWYYLGPANRHAEKGSAS